jgi:hypothetical protein
MKHYAQRDHRALGEHYLRHVSAMTGEGLHAKSDIAAELAWRDAEIERLQALLACPVLLWPKAMPDEVAKWISAHPPQFVSPYPREAE